MPGADGAGQRTAEGKVDGKTDLLGSRMMQTGRGEERGGVPSVSTCTLTCSLSCPSCCGAQMPRGSSSAASRARTHR